MQALAARYAMSEAAGGGGRGRGAWDHGEAGGSATLVVAGGSMGGGRGWADCESGLIPVTGCPKMTCRSGPEICPRINNLPPTPPLSHTPAALYTPQPIMAHYPVFQQ